MGSCASRFPAPASSTAGSSGRRAATAKVVGLDGSMAQYAAPVTAGEALGHAARGSSFLCSSNELRFDAPPRALVDEEKLQPGWLYFVLPVSMLRLVLSAHEMAVLAIRASSALAVASGVASPLRRKNVAGAYGRHRKARVAPLVVADENAELADGGWSSQHSYGKYGDGASKTVHGDGETAGKMGKLSGGYRSRRGSRRRRAAGVQRLTAILEADEF